MTPSLIEPDSEDITLLHQMHATLKIMQQDLKQLATVMENINGRVNILSGVKQVREEAGDHNHSAKAAVYSESITYDRSGFDSKITSQSNPDLDKTKNIPRASDMRATPRSNTSSRIILTTYPGQSGIDPFMMRWGHKDPMQRGPVVVARTQSTIRRRNGRVDFTISET